MDGPTRKRKASNTDPSMSGGSTSLDEHSNQSTTGSRVQQIIPTPYNGPTKVYVTILGVMGESSLRPVPQSAFFSLDKALAFAQNILVQFCKNHYSDFNWQGPKTMVENFVFRYVAVESESEVVVAVADVVRVSIFDADETEMLDHGEEQSQGDVGREQMEGSGEIMDSEEKTMMEALSKCVVG